MLDESQQAILQSNAALDEGLRLRQYWSIVLERRWLIISIFTVIFLLSVIYAFKATPVYMASARIQIDREPMGLLNSSQAYYDPREQDYLQTQYRNLVSRTLIEEVIHKLKLDEDPYYKGYRELVENVIGNIIVVPTRMTRLVDVRALHTEPQKAMDVANTLVEKFLSQNLQLKTDRALDTFKMLRNQADTLGREFNEANRDLQRYRETNQMVSLRDEGNIVIQTLRNSQTIVDESRRTSNDHQKVADQAQKWLAEGKPLADLPQMAMDDLVVRLKADKLKEEATLKALDTKYGYKHPLIIAAKESVAKLERELDKETRRVYEGILEKARLERSKLEKAEADLKSRELETTRYHRLKVDYDDLQLRADRAKFLYEQVLAKMKEFDFNSRDTLQNMRIVDRAVLPYRPVKPNQPFVILFGMLAGLGLALGVAFIVNYLDDSIKSQEDVENHLHLPFLGYVTNIKSTSVVERDLQAHHHPTSTAAEAFRTLRASVSLARNADKLRLIAVTSTIPSEGKSLVASNFAIVTAQTGLRTLLIDADLRRPSVHKAFQLQSPVGLSSYLAERVNNVSEFIHGTEVPNLDVVCCGSTPSNPSELIGSKRMIQFLEEVSSRYDRVVLDCPPISAVADPMVVGAMCDGMIFVTKFNKIRREHALRSIQRLQAAGIHLLGVVLNDIDFEGKDSYYYSYYYYQNRYYASHYRTKSTDKKPKAKPAAKTVSDA